MLLKNFISKESLSCIDFLRKNKVVYGSCAKLPFENDSVELVYSCHMCEHLYRDELFKFINESYRVLKKGGVLRIVIPDLSILIVEYIKEKDADSFLQSLYFQDCREKLSLLNKFKFLIYRNRLHKWMYNGTSFKNLVESNSPLNRISLFIFLVYYFYLLNFPVENLKKIEIISLSIMSLSIFCYFIGAFQISIIAERYPEALNLIFVIFFPLLEKRIKEKYIFNILVFIYLVLLNMQYGTFKTLLGYYL